MRYPDRAELSQLAQDLNFDLTEEELDIMYERTARQMESIERLMHSSHLAASSGPGRVEGVARDWFIPSPEDDPFNVFACRCDVACQTDGPLSGLSVGLKDTIAVAGIPMSLGARSLMNYVPEFDAIVTQRLIHSGARILGKLNMYGFSSGDATGDLGRVLNPEAPDRETGGSSSGSAAAVAAGLVDVALGGDQGGSVRIPAAWCDVVGFKPTYGLVPHTGIFGGDPTVDHVGPLARSVETVARVMDALAGPDGLDTRQAGVPESCDRFMEALEQGVAGKRVCVLKEGFGEEGGASNSVPVQAMTEALTVAGAQVREISVPLHDLAAEAWFAIWLEGTWYMNQSFLGAAMQRTWYPETLMQAIGHLGRAAGHSLPYNYRQMVLMGGYLHRKFFGTIYGRSQNLREPILKAYDEAFREADLLILPTMSTLPPRFNVGSTYHDRVDLTVFGGGGLDLAQFVRNVAPFSYTGHPAISVPCGHVDGLPVGGQIVGRFFEDALVLRAARVVEKWMHR